VQSSDNLTTFMYWLSWNLGATTSWNHQGLSRPVQGLLYLYRVIEKSLCTCARRVMHCTGSGGVPHIKHLKWHTRTLSCSPNPPQCHTLGQLCCTFIHCDFYCNLYPTFDRGTGTCYSFCIILKNRGKGKAIPLQSWTGPKGSRRLRLPDFKTISTWRW